VAVVVGTGDTLTQSEYGRPCPHRGERSRQQGRHRALVGSFVPWKSTMGLAGSQSSESNSSCPDVAAPRRSITVPMQVSNEGCICATTAVASPFSYRGAHP